MGFSLVNGACQMICPLGCQSCTNSTFCTACHPYTYLVNNTCQKCPGAPYCMMCSASNPSQCTQCGYGYFLSNGSCLACPSYCAACNNANWCTVLINPIGYTLFSLPPSSNTLAACDPGCSFCSTSNPQVCITCMEGYYLTARSYCKACTTGNKCASCSPTNSSLCTSCFAGYFLNATNNMCMSCNFPCTACINQVATSCSSCAIGYVLVANNNTCIQASSPSLSNFGSVI
jgi:proprotein convertase subtilisin/kexin type 5